MALNLEFTDIIYLSVLSKQLFYISSIFFSFFLVSPCLGVAAQSFME